MAEAVRLGRIAIPRVTGWHLFATLLMVSLAGEYWDKDPLVVGGLTLPWPRFLVALAVLPLIIPPAQRRWSEFLRYPRSLSPLLVFWCCCGLSVLSVLTAPGASSLRQYVPTFAHLSLYVVFVAGFLKWTTPHRLLMLVQMYYVLGIVAALLAVLQWVHGAFDVWPGLAAIRLQSAEHQINTEVTTGFRAASFFGEPSWAARYYVHFIAVALAYWTTSGDRRHLAALALFVLAFYAANSLLGYVILGAFGGLLLLAQIRKSNLFSLSRRKKLALGALAYVMVLALLLGFSPRRPDLIDRSVTRIGLVFEGGGAVGNRIDGVFAGLEVWKLAPVIGVGLGNIDVYIVPFYRDPEWVLRSRHSSDSLYVQVMAETGVIGLIAFLWFWVNLVWYRQAEVSGREPAEVVRLRALLRFLQVDLIAQAVGMLNSSDYLNPHLWTIVAVVLSAKLLLRHESLRAGAARVEPASLRPLVPVYAP